MSKRVTAVAALALALAAALTAALAAQPAAFRVERSAEVAAPPTLVREALVDLRRWGGWWRPADADPAAQRTFGGPPAGLGASAFWPASGGRSDGRLTVVGDGPGRIEVEYQRTSPAPIDLDLELSVAPAGEGSRVTFAVLGESGLARRLAAVVWGRDAELGPGLEAALRALAACSAEEARTAPVRAERRALVAAPPEAVLAALADLGRWSAWSPWDRPAAAGRWTSGGPARGVGRSAYWSAEGQGSGRLTVTGAEAGRLEVEREAERGWPATSDHAFEVVDEGGGARVTWVISAGPAPAPERLAAAGEALGLDLERGLASLKAVVEQRPEGRP